MLNNSEFINVVYSYAAVRSSRQPERLSWIDSAA